MAGSSVKSECVTIHSLSSCVTAMGRRKDAQKNLTCRDGVQVLGTQANLVKEHSTDYLGVMQKDCASMLHRSLNLFILDMKMYRSCSTA